MADASTPELWAIPFSPWSLKTKWALHHCGIEYSVRKYDVPQSEWALRLKLRRWYVTAPTLLGKDLVLTDSYDIAKYADDRRPQGQESLFCEGVSELVALGQAFAEQERARSLITIMNDPELLNKCVPPGLAWLGPLGPVLVKSGLSGMLHKFKVTEYDESVSRAKLQELRGLLQKAGGGYLLQNRLTWADMSTIFALQTVAVAPQLRPDQTFPLPDAMGSATLAAEFSDLFQWRDRLLDKHWPNVA